MNSRRRS